MAYKKPPVKTDQEWNQIRFQNSIGPAVGGLIHDAVALAIAVREQHKNYKDYDICADVKIYLDTLWEIAEKKKTELTEIKPVSREKATQAGIEFNKRIEKDSKLEDLNNKLDEIPEKETLAERAQNIKQETAYEKEMDKREDQQFKYGPDNRPQKNEHRT